jgi:hypothetical protein
MKMEQSVPKRRHINFRRRGITQKKAYNRNTILRQRKGNYDTVDWKLKKVHEPLLLTSFKA